MIAMPNGSSYSYDAENHLLSTAGVNYTGVYPERSRGDGDGNRVEKSSGTIYWQGGLDESNLSGTLTNEYIFFPSASLGAGSGARIARRDPSSNVFYNFSDHLGTARSIAEVPSGQTTATKCYDADLYPFGGERWYTDSCDSHFKFTGKERDSESGLDNFGARYNSSSMGRFMSPDPTFASSRKASPQTWNRYSYVLDNPLAFVDPDGEVWQQSITGSWDWMDKCNAGATCRTEFAQQEGENVVVYGPSSKDDKKTFYPDPNGNGYVDISAIAATDGAYFTLKSGASSYLSPQSAVDLYNGAYDYHVDYPKDDKLVLTDAGNSTGTNFGPHQAHNLGRAVDLRYMDENGHALTGENSALLADDDRMRDMVRIFEENGFNENYSDNDQNLGIQWAPNHSSHIHFGKTLGLAQCEIGPCK